ncbi:MAG: imidazole glycerol phosphate synthase subunit HisH [Bacteroidetes bacterium]|nr:imidazole glycerol phosphate synthase subunit HisH [Bacteroidota bacterium]
MIAIIDYGAGNITSVRNSLRRLNVEVLLTHKKEELLQADKIIFPGVGEAGYAMKQLIDKDLVDFIPQLKVPVLGVCLGMQLLCRHTEEGDVSCLNVFETNVKAFPKLNIGDKIPHMGWNNHTAVNGSLFEGIGCDEDFYFVHGYYAELNLQTVATSDYIVPFASALRKNNFYATQFHPEKSADPGERLIKNFLKL